MAKQLDPTEQAKAEHEAYLAALDRELAYFSGREGSDKRIKEIEAEIQRAKKAGYEKTRLRVETAGGARPR